LAGTGPGTDDRVSAGTATVVVLPLFDGMRRDLREQVDRAVSSCLFNVELSRC
jgi:hypothetical protein